jgi:hypothetical protein
MARPDFSEVWHRIGAHAGRIFETKRGIQFTYMVDGNGFFPEGRNHRIAISDIENAYGNVPCEGPSDISNGIRAIRGQSYVWAVFHDSRIRQGDW